jgi:hypothetical protein
MTAPNICLNWLFLDSRFCLTVNGELERFHDKPQSLGVEAITLIDKVQPLNSEVQTLAHEAPRFNGEVQRFTREYQRLSDEV